MRVVRREYDIYTQWGRSHRSQLSVNNLMQAASITDYFTSESQNESGSVTMLAQGPEDRKVLYLTNQLGHKLLKIVVKSEPGSHHNKQHAQIKLIPYGIKHAIVWQDQPSDPKLVALHDGVDLTYRGGKDNDQTTKVHIKATAGYATLIDDSLNLPADVEMPVPLFSFDTGYDNQRPLANHVTKKATFPQRVAHWPCGLIAIWRVRV